MVEYFGEVIKYQKKLRDMSVGTLPNGYAQSVPLPWLRADSYGPHHSSHIMTQSHPSVAAEPHQSAQVHSAIRARPLVNCRIK